MLTFREFVSDEDLGCVIHAETGKEHVRFDISGLILMDSLGGGNPVHDEDNVKLCEQRRAIIEAACQRAYDEQPGKRIRLELRHFTQA